MKTKQVDVSPAMRAILIDWLVEVAEEYKLTTDTVFVCVRVLAALPRRTSRVDADFLLTVVYRRP